MHILYISCKLISHFLFAHKLESSQDSIKMMDCVKLDKSASTAKQQKQAGLLLLFSPLFPTLHLKLKKENRECISCEMNSLPFSAVDHNGWVTTLTGIFLLVCQRLIYCNWQLVLDNGRQILSRFKFLILLSAKT